MSIRKFQSGMIFFSGLTLLVLALQIFARALKYSGAENQYLVENMGFTVTVLLALFFGLGWLCSNLFEYLAKINYRKTAFFILLAPVLAVFFYKVTTQFTSSFWSFVIFSCVMIFFSGQLLRLSVIHLDELAKLWESK